MEPSQRQRLNTRHSDAQPASPTAAHSPSSLAAAATMNAGLRNQERNLSHGDASQSQSLERRRSSIRMSLAMNDPGMPAPGELAASPAASRRLSTSLAGPPSPGRHVRALSLGELHQELENEQEAQVNRLLGMIRQQQLQIDQLQSTHPTNSHAVEDSRPPSDVSGAQTPSLSHSSHRRPSAMSQALNNSSGHSHSPSPSLRAQRSFSHRNSSTAAIEDFPSLSHHATGSSASPNLRADESAYFQAETQSLTRENQMLKARIRELERQLAEADGLGGPAAHSPIRRSSLHSAAVQE